ncbi:hypothetical protein BZM26_27085 [Paraburkholderia strydomiana]|nr:hypothetical protein BZM26_27085 [Paraburkholderia strydomiana]
MNEDPLTASALLLNYHIVDHFSVRNGIPALLLEANANQTPYSEQRLSTQKMKLDQWYAVPQAGPGVVKLKPHLRFTLAGRLRNLLFRGGVLKIQYKLRTGEVREVRANVLNSASGLWASPLLDNFSLQGQPVKSVMLTSNPSDYIRPEFDTDWVLVPIDSVQPAQVKMDTRQ